jgi:hypothetical protein
MAKEHVAKPFERQDRALMDRTEAGRAVALSRLSCASSSRVATVMVAHDQVMLAVQSREDLAHEIVAHREVAEVPNLIVGPYHFVVPSNHLDVHLVRIRERPPAVFDYTYMSKVLVTREEAHGTHFESKL